MNTDFINSLKLAVMGMAAIFLVILVIYLFVHVFLKITGRKKKS